MNSIKKATKKLIGQTLINFVKCIKYKHFPSRREQYFLQQRKEFNSTLIKPGELCFDVGANIDNRIKPLLLAGSKVVAVEPQKSCYEPLKMVYGSEMELVTKGLSDVEGTKDFYISNVSVVSSFSDKWINSVKDRFAEYKWERTEK